MHYPLEFHLASRCSIHTKSRLREASQEPMIKPQNNKLLLKYLKLTLVQYIKYFEVVINSGLSGALFPFSTPQAI